MDARQNIVAEISWPTAACIWWKIMWRAVLWAVLAGVVLGTVLGLVVGVMNIPKESVQSVGTVLGALLGVTANIWVIRTVFNKKNRIGRYRLAVLDEGDDAPPAPQ